jgi:hypothetical protein
VRRRSSSLSRPSCSSMRRGSLERSASFCRPWLWRSSSGTRSRSASRATRRCFSALRWLSRRSAAGSRQVDAVASSRGSWVSRSGPGLEGSTCVRLHGPRPTGPTACGRFRSSVSARPRDLRVTHVVTVPALRCSGLLRTWAGVSRRRGRRRCTACFEQSLVRADLSQVKRAFDLNG